MPLWYPSAASANVVADLMGGMTPSTPAIGAHRANRHAFPENTMPGYQAALNGTDFAEVSTSKLADGTFVCMHDLTGDRTTNWSGTLANITYPKLLRDVAVDIGATCCGAGWANQPVPLLTDVIDLMAGHIPLLVEAKTGSTADMASLYDLFGRWGNPTQKFMIKAYRSGTGAAGATTAAARARGYLTWVYYDAADSDAMLTVGANDPNVSILALHADTATTERIALAAATGKPVCVHNVFRRSEVTTLTGRGASMIMSPQALYCRRTTAALTATHWADQLRDPGEIKYTADSDTFPVLTVADRSMSLASGASNTVLLGQLAGTTAPSTMTIDFGISWDTLPSATLHGGIAFGKADDTGFQFQSATNSNGYHFIFRPNEGYGQLYTHTYGSTSGTQIGALVAGDQVPLSAGAWATFRIVITATDITFTRTDLGAPTPVTVANTHSRGPYIHATPNTSGTTVKLRDVTVS